MAESNANERSTVYKNKPSTSTIVMGFGFFIFTLIVGLSYGDLKTLLLCILFGSFFLIVALYGAIGRTPKEFVIKDDSIVLVPYLGRKSEIRYQDIEFVMIHPQDEVEWLKKSVSEGVIKPRRMGMFVITAEIGKATREAYFKKMNKYPIDNLKTYQRNRKEHRIARRKE
jgi:hypothetical protein